MRCLAVVGRLPDLRHFRADSNFPVTDKDLAYLAGLQSLGVVEICNAQRLTDSSLKLLAGLPKLKAVIIGVAPIAAPAPVAIAKRAAPVGANKNRPRLQGGVGALSAD